MCDQFKVRPVFYSLLLMRYSSKKYVFAHFLLIGIRNVVRCSIGCETQVQAQRAPYLCMRPVKSIIEL